MKASNANHKPKSLVTQVLTNVHIYAIQEVGIAVQNDWFAMTDSTKLATGTKVSLAEAPKSE